ncbi:unnamed protein product [Leptosia nina]|uniref:Cytochrome P450 n=1 Tax=Leptosia nina TaxID=320188 RepID=A0AAV1ISJ7_9NEOP
MDSGDKWRERRKILTPAFHFNILRNFYTILVENTEKFVHQIDMETTKEKSDIFDLVTDFTLKSLCETAMGTKLDDETSEFGRTYKNAIHDLGNIVLHRAQRVWMYPTFMFSLTKFGRTQKKLLDLISSFRDRVVKKRRDDSINVKNIHFNDNEDDFVIYGKKRLAMLDLLLEAEKNGTINMQGVNEEVDTFMFEGHDTTATALQFTFMILANHQEIQDKIVEECNAIVSAEKMPTMNDLSQMKYLDCCIKESLRMFPPVFFISRKIDESVILSTYECPPGSEIHIMIRELHHVCKQFENPFDFRPERFMKEPTWHQYAYIPFSAGPRNCIGQKFAMMEMKLALSTVLRRYKVLAVTKPEDISYLADFILRSKDPVYVKFERRFT